MRSCLLSETAVVAKVVCNFPRMQTAHLLRLRIDPSAANLEENALPERILFFISIALEKDLRYLQPPGPRIKHRAI